MLLPCCTELSVAIGNPLILLEALSNSLQHEIGLKNEADTAINPYFIG